jgi:hypothetical protein
LAPPLKIAKTGARNKALNEYVRKRDFARTPEPPPEPAGHTAGAFVVQKHAVRRLHYDAMLNAARVHGSPMTVFAMKSQRSPSRCHPKAAEKDPQEVEQKGEGGHGPL